MIKFVAMSPSELSNFLNALRKSSPASSIPGLARQIAAGNSELDFDDICDVLEMFASLYRYRADLGASSKEIVESVVSAAKQETSRGRIPELIVWSKFKESLRAIFESSGALAITAKASELSLENERTFCPASTRVLTDIRPIFLAGSSEAPHAAIIQHRLKIAYHAETGKTDEFFVTLDRDDVEILIYHLIRAQDKEKSLRKLLKSTGVRLMASEEDEK